MLAMLLAASPALAVPSLINYQGKLTDAGGNPLDGTFSMTFRLYSVPSSGSPIWTETQSVFVADGIYSVELGSVNSFPSGLFDNAALYLEVVIGSETLSPRQQLISTAFSMKAGDAETLDGMDSTELDQSGHANDTGNPHSVTPAQIGAASSSDFISHEANDSAHHSKTTSFTEMTDQATDAQIPNDITISYAASAGNADTVDSLHAGHFMPAGTDLWVNTSGDDMSGRFSVETNTLGGVWTESIYGYLNTPDYGAGVYGLANGSDAHGVHGGATGANGTGVFGEVDKDWGIGVYGINHFRSNYGYLGYRDAGVYGKNAENGNDGRIGSFWEGVRGYSPGGGRGVIGVSVDGEGVRGSSTNNVGIYGHSDTGAAGFFSSGNDHEDLYLGGSIGRINTDPENENSDLILSSNNDVIVRLDNDGGENGVFKIKSSGGTDVVSVDESGYTTVGVLKITGGADLCEQFDIRSIKGELLPSPGMVVSIDPRSPGDLVISQEPYDRRVAGIISGAGGVKPGMLMGQEGSKANGVNPVALTGRVYCWADASNGPIESGDLLTTSDVPGHAMKVTDYGKALGAILGKAMSSLEEGKGLVLVLVTLQ